MKCAMNSQSNIIMSDDVNLVDIIYLLFTRMPGESYRMTQVFVAVFV